MMKLKEIDYLTIVGINEKKKGCYSAIYELELINYCRINRSMK